MKRSGYIQRRTPPRARGKTAHARRARDWDFMTWVRTQPCIARLLAQGFECSGPIQADHVGGRYVKPVDRNCVPMCEEHHRQRTGKVGGGGVFAGWSLERRREWGSSSRCRNPRSVGGAVLTWAVTHKFDVACARLADGHYSRRKVGSPQFMPPGQTLVLRAPGAVWGWWRPHPRSGIKSMNGLDGWTCSIFRRVDGEPASDMVIAAERELVLAGHGCGPDGLLTYVWPAKIASINPGYCFKLAGWHSAGRRHQCCQHMKRRSADGRKVLLHKPWGLAGVGAAQPPRREAAP